MSVYRTRTRHIGPGYFRQRTPEHYQFIISTPFLNCLYISPDITGNIQFGSRDYSAYCDSTNRDFQFSVNVRQDDAFYL